MRCRAGMTAVLIVGACLAPATAATAAPQPILPFPLPIPGGWRLPEGWRLPVEPDLSQVPPRTSISVRAVVPGADASPSGMRWGTANESESRAGLSISKLYLADYALRHGDGSTEDRDLGERMIRSSDDAAADRIAAKYPTAIDATAAEYGLTGTHSAGGWRLSTTSTADVADFLAAKIRTEPDSPILDWMRHPSDFAADGTRQDWGTARLPEVLGSKWGWSDIGDPEVASASFGPGFTVAAITLGTAQQQNDDVDSAFASLTELFSQLKPGH